MSTRVDVQRTNQSIQLTIVSDDDTEHTLVVTPDTLRGIANVIHIWMDKPFAVAHTPGFSTPLQHVWWEDGACGIEWSVPGCPPAVLSAGVGSIDNTADDIHKS